MKNWKKKIYIASKIGTLLDDNGNEFTIYDVPKLYKFNVQPINSNVDLVEFGEKSSMIQKAVIPIRYKHCFKENDLAYLDDVIPDNEKVNGINANYRLYPPRNQNKVIILYFERISGR